VALGYAKALSRAGRLVYVEDQYLWSRTVAAVFADALRRAPDLRMLAVVPRFPDSDGLRGAAADAAQAEAVELLRRAGGDRVHLFDLENEAGTPIYVHAKICLIDDTWAAVGSANLNRRSWTHDSELTAAVITAGGGDSFALRLRLRDLLRGADALVEQARRMEAWNADGRTGVRPPGRLRPHRLPEVPIRRKTALEPFVRLVADPDGRCLSMRLRDAW
jgi:phosphatidylserine/phosphatidylglycerophosphate/cardiolipin synthase-like enzyme